MTRRAELASSPDVFKAILAAEKLPAPHQEFRFLDSRRFRFDWAWPAKLVALETEGGVWTRGRHTRGSGFVRDMEKYNLAALQGWRVFRIQPHQLCLPSTIDLLKQALEAV